MDPKTVEKTLTYYREYVSQTDPQRPQRNGKSSYAVYNVNDKHLGWVVQDHKGRWRVLTPWPVKKYGESFSRRRDAAHFLVFLTSGKKDPQIEYDEALAAIDPENSTWEQRRRAKDAGKNLAVRRGTK